MRFSSIEIKNYRQYRDLKLEFKHGEHDLQVLIGDNGTGKTNLLNAFTWCLYGKEPHLGIEDIKKGEPKLNKDALAEAFEASKFEVTVSIAIELEDRNDVIRVERQLPCRVKSRTEITEKIADESFRLTRIPEDGNAKVFSDEAAEIRVNQLLPESIREYFFFDGEQLTSYFSDTRGEAIRAAIYSISQIDVITRMKENLANVVKELTRNAKNASPDLQKYTDAVEQREKQYKHACKQIEECESGARDLTIKIDDLNEKLRGVPNIAALEAKRLSLQEKINRAAQTEVDQQDAFVRFARDSFINFAFYDVAKATLDVISEMEKNNQLPPSIDSSYLQEMIHEHVCKVCKRPLSDDEVTTLQLLLEQQQVSSKTSNILSSMRSELRRIVSSVQAYPSSRDAIVRALRNAEATHREYVVEFNEVDAQIRNTPNTDLVKHWQEEREKYTRMRSDLDTKKGEHLRVMKSAKNLLDAAIKDRDKAIRQVDQLQELSSNIAFGTEAHAILEQAEREIISSVRHEMEKRTEELFKGLVWKDSKCDHIELNRSFNLSLYDAAGFSCAGTCSAAERALLALSFTLAMHQVSGFESPLFIDTPIARASGQNRANFAKTLAEVSSNKQIILTFTPDEYSEAIANVFDPIAATHLRLTLDEDHRVVSLKGN